MYGSLAIRELVRAGRRLRAGQRVFVLWTDEGWRVL